MSSNDLHEKRHNCTGCICLILLETEKMSIADKGRLPVPNLMNFRKTSKRPLTPPPPRWYNKLALLIFAQTISIPMWYRYGFLSFLAVFEISSAKEHIFDSCKCITYLLGWVLSKISKKPYLYQAGIDMVFSIFSSSNFHGRTQMYSG